MRDLAYTMKTKIFMPDELIVVRNEESKEIYYIVEGTA